MQKSYKSNIAIKLFTNTLAALSVMWYQREIYHCINNIHCTFITCRHWTTCPMWCCIFLLSSFGGEPGCSDMVIFFEWHRTAVDQRRRSGLPMTGEDTGLGALASPLAGYLGKVSRAYAFLSLLSLAQSWIIFEKYCDWAVPIQIKEKKRKHKRKSLVKGERLGLAWSL